MVVRILGSKPEDVREVCRRLQEDGRARKESQSIVGITTHEASSPLATAGLISQSKEIIGSEGYHCHNFSETNGSTTGGQYKDVRWRRKPA
jgi:predicted metalloprotease with PDZ domain